AAGFALVGRIRRRNAPYDNDLRHPQGRREGRPRRGAEPRHAGLPGGYVTTAQRLPRNLGAVLDHWGRCSALAKRRALLGSGQRRVYSLSPGAVSVTVVGGSGRSSTLVIGNGSDGGALLATCGRAERCTKSQ